MTLNPSLVGYPTHPSQSCKTCEELDQGLEGSRVCDEEAGVGKNYLVQHTTGSGKSYSTGLLLSEETERLG
jgi:hypothetical protein